jgi:orotate phosphoribosyltransferase-like protein
MITGEFTAGVRILLEKGLSRHHISEYQQLSENTQKFLFGQKTDGA